MLRGAECSLCSSPADEQNITARPGDDVTLMCRDPEYEKISLLEWRRKDSEILFVFRDGRPLPAVTHEFYENRVFLNDRQMKDGDLSVVLKNVTMNDTGTYECKIRHENDPPLDPLQLSSTIHLSVVPPGPSAPPSVSELLIFSWRQISSSEEDSDSIRPQQLHVGGRTVFRPACLCSAEPSGSGLSV
uniref:Ig-like domain-containing protein n=1 Tax=Oryzias latipes TaxID=8090 RepID=A0A3P9IL18_ORYLA